MNKKQDRIKSLKNARKALDRRRKHNSTDAAPIYITYRHPDNLFAIDYPAHWKIEKTDDGSVEFSATETDDWAGIMLFRIPMPIEAEQIEKTGRFKQIAAAMFAKVNSNNVRSDPTIIYNNYTADRPEENQAGQRWFVLAADLMLGISTSCSVEKKEVYIPLFERMLSSLRINRDDELLASRILTRVLRAITAALPDAKVQNDGLTIKTDKFEVSIENLMAQVKRNPIRLDEIVDQFIRGTLGLSRHQETLGQESWDEVRGRIQPMLKSDKYIQEANERTTRKGQDSDSSSFLVSLPWLADLRICFALDDKATFRFINSYDIQRWNVSLETIAQVALENLEALPEPKLLVMKIDENEPAVGGLQPSAGAVSSYLLHPKLHKIVSSQMEGEIAAAVPSRDALILFEYRGQRAALLKAVSHDFSTTNHPVSDRLFRVTPDGIALL
ncbi:DUF1444 family protein [Pirellulaceae bacterium SH449]